METNTTEPRAGRRAAFTPELAYDVLDARRSGFQDSPTTESFIASLVTEGVLPRPVHPRTMQKLLNGIFYPDLIDKTTGQKFDYATLPKFKRGHPRLYPGAVNYETGEPRPRMSKMRRELMECTLEAAHQRLVAELVLRDQKLREAFSKKFSELEARIDRLSARRPQPFVHLSFDKKETGNE